MKWKNSFRKSKGESFNLRYFRNYWFQKEVVTASALTIILTSEQLFGNQPVNGSKNCFKSARHYYYPIFPWIWDKLSRKKSALVRSKILGLFVNTLTAEYTYSRRNMQTFTQHIQTPLSLKQKTFSGFFIAFLKSTWNGEHFQKKGESSSLSSSSISEIIDSKSGGYLRAWKALLKEQLSVINLLTGSKHCLNLHGTTIILFFLWIWDKLSMKKSALVRSGNIRTAFVNTLTAEYTYSRRNMQTFTQHIQ